MGNTNLFECMENYEYIYEGFFEHSQKLLGNIPTALLIVGKK